MELDTLMTRFRLASRELFNHYFHASTHDEDEWITEERFALIQEQLFNALVIEPAALPNVRYGEVNSSIKTSLRNGTFGPWMLNREIDSGYWDHSLEEFTGSAELHFVHFFDWDQVDFKDHRYVQVVIASWPEHPELLGKHALVESQYLRFDTV